MDSKPVISVIIPTYNSAQYIVKTLESVFAQTYKDYEVIVVDDSSTDNTKDVLTPYMGRIKYIYKQNGGPASARNTGIKAASGSYVAFLDSDDIWMPEKLGEQAELVINDDELALVFSNRIDFDENDIERNREIAKKFIADDMRLNIWWDNPVTTSSVLMKRACFNEIGVFDEAKDVEGSEDCDMWLRVACKYRIGYLPKVLVRHRVRNSGHNRSNIERAYSSSKKVLDRYWLVLRQNGFSQKLYNTRMHKFYSNYGFTLISINNFKDANLCFKKAFLYNPLSIKTAVYFLATMLPERQIGFLRAKKRRVGTHV